MPRPILGAQTRSPSLTVGAQHTTRQKTNLSRAQIEHRLRQKRSARYIQQMTRLDAGTHLQNAAALQELLEVIVAEFPELGIDERPLGIVARCQLGPPYQVHICDLTGSIVEHFDSRSMPPLFERARALAAHGAYAFIEIYATTMRAVSADGSIAVLNM